MAYRKKSGFKRRGTKRRTYRSKAVSKGAKKVMRKIAKTEISRLSEDKCQISVNNAWIIGAGTNNYLDQSIIRVTGAAIQAGTGRDDRIGNSINIKRLTFSGGISPYPYDATNNPAPQAHLVDVYCFYDKENPTGINPATGAYLAPTPAANSDFFKATGSNDGAQGFYHNIADHYQIVNSNRYKVVWKKTFKVGNQSYIGTTGAGSATQQVWTNNDFKLMNFTSSNLTKYVNKTWKYRSSTDNYPQNHGLWLLFVPMKLDGGSWGAGYNVDLISYRLMNTFEDN